ncbi:MAG: DUF3336 domain-containing protein [Gammaproteobacteria bacterium]|nr:DUF3336 domain-containing protein [Gammaproteobacteria bacterium]MBT8150801.1 DUF3336 domain-containing protein [Gammaproteobacteria bacterium]NND38861.1 DUF3336 domain-containing protein [Pseudomonadales bacterium]NNL10383.1 DUF3336 domain-containing protein [Pseudomonadales bacterium]RZV60226.1 MAG: DUF3336 domain-containing protein [Pseudomonadales bacterium]
MITILGSKKYERSMNNAETYEEWLEAATNHDKATGAHRWRVMDQTRRYDYVSIRIRLDRLRAMRARHDNRGLLFTLNEGIHGNMAGMGHPRLYTKAKSGTKTLIVDYVEEIVDSLRYLASQTVTDISFEEKIEFFRRAQHCFGCSALMLSGSGSLAYFHMGVVKTLLAHDLLPDIVSGSSGGSMVGAFIATQNISDVETMFDPENIAEAFGANDFNRDQTQNLRADDLYDALEKLVPDLTFEEAFDLTGRKLNVSVAPLETMQTSRLLNAITSPNVYIREAVMASCAIPGIFPPVTLSAKNDHGERQAYLPSRQWVDGSVSDDLPAKRLARLYGANHYIVSQTNPHVLPFLSGERSDAGPLRQMARASMETLRTWMNASAEIARKPISKSQMLSRMSSLALSIINQEYQGDITILPAQRFMNPLKLLKLREPEDVQRLMGMGERSTWPKLEMIRTQTEIGAALGEILNEFEEEVLDTATEIANQRAG